MHKEIVQDIASCPPEDLCDYVADLSRQLSKLVRNRGFSTIAGLLELASSEAKQVRLNTTGGNSCS